MGVLDAIKNINPFKKVEKAAVAPSVRPYVADGTVDRTSTIPRYAYSLSVIERAARESDTLVAIQRALRMEMFRNGIELAQAENVMEDTSTADEELTIQERDVDAERSQILGTLENINQKGEHVLDVLEQIEDDYNTFDLAFMFFLFDYELDDKGLIVNKHFREAARLDPKTVQFVVNNRHEFGKDDRGQWIMVSPKDRQRVHTNKQFDEEGNALYPAHYRQRTPHGDYYFFEWEVVHDSRYRPELLTGFSPIITVWNKMSTLMFQDLFMLEYYRGKRPPKSMLLFGTANQEALKKAWDNMIERVRTNPHLPAIMGVPTDPNRKGKPAEFIDFMRSMEEMQFTDVRNEFRRQIGAVFGVLPLWQGDMSQGGGLNNEGLQVTVTNRAVEYGQNRYNRKFLPPLINAMNYAGWSLRLNPNEEQDEMAKLQRQQQSLVNGRLAAELGLTAEYDENTGEVNISKGTLEAPQSGFDSGFGDFGSTPAQSGSPPSPNSQEAPSGDVGKSLKKNEKRQPFTKLSNILQAEIGQFLKKFKRFPTRKELEDKVLKIRGNLQAELQTASRDLFEKAYKSQMRQVGKEFGVDMSFGDRDLEAIEVLSSQKVLTDSYKSITDKVANKLQEVLQKAYETPGGLNLGQIQKEISELAGIADSRAEAIARTEMSKVSVAARRNSYKKADPDGNLLYKHIGPQDNRTTDTSKRIKERTKGGVSWEDYVVIVKEESMKDFPEWTVNADFPVSHYQSRHVPVAIQNR